MTILQMAGFFSLANYDLKSTATTGVTAAPTTVAAAEPIGTVRERRQAKVAVPASSAVVPDAGARFSVVTIIIVELVLLQVCCCCCSRSGSFCASCLYL